VRRPIRRMKLIFSGVCTHARTQGRKHTHIRRMHTFKWLYEIGQETTTTHAVHQNVPMKPVDIPRPPKFGFIQPGPKKRTKKMININDNHEIKITRKIRSFFQWWLFGTWEGLCSNCAWAGLAWRRSRFL
jgi:hypothetical protein